MNEVNKNTQWVDPIEVRIEQAKNNIFGIINMSLNELNVPVNVVEMILNDAISQVDKQKNMFFDNVNAQHKKWIEENSNTEMVDENNNGDETFTDE